MTDPTRPSPWPLAVTAAFGTTVAMWCAGFITHLPGLIWPGPAAAGAILAAFAAGMILAGRAARATPGFTAAFGALSCGLAGLLTSLVNLLVLGALLASPDDSANALRPGWSVVVGGWLAIGAVLGLVGGHIGGLTASNAQPRRRHWHARFAAIAAIAVLPLVLAGGLVTSHEAGMAVPDWPNSFGSNMFLYPLARMTGGIYYEHAHRLFGSLVGLTTIVFTVFTFLATKRLPLRLLSVAALLFVIVQGVLGGQRVTMDNVTLGMIHGVTGQLFLAFMAALAAMSSPRWAGDERPAPTTPPGAPRLVATLLLCALVVQLVFGAMLRHYGPERGAHAMLAHIANAFIVLVLAIGAGVRAGAARPGDRLFRRLGMGLMHASFTQVALGFAALWAVLAHKDDAAPHTTDILLTTAHQFLGAAIICLAALLFAWSRRLVLPRSAAAATPTTA